MNCFEWWSAEISFFVTGAISEAELAINSILINVFIVIFMVRETAITLIILMSSLFTISSYMLEWA